jgi:hypothetical protein
MVQVLELQGSEFNPQYCKTKAVVAQLCFALEVRV